MFAGVYLHPFYKKNIQTEQNQNGIQSVTLYRFKCLLVFIYILFTKKIYKLNKIRMEYSQLHCIGGHDASNIDT